MNPEGTHRAHDRIGRGQTPRHRPHRRLGCIGVAAVAAVLFFLS